MDEKTVHLNILSFRKSLNLSRQELADSVGVSRTAIENWEKGESSPDIHKAFLLAKALGVSINELVGEKEAIYFDSKKANEAIETMKEIVSAASLPNCPRDIFEDLAAFGPNDGKLWETIRRSIDVYLSLSEDEKGKKKTKRTA